MPRSKNSAPEKKKFLLSLGLISFLGLLLVFYSLNLKNVFQFNYESSSEKEDFDWGQIKEDFSTTFNQVTQDFKAAKNKQIAQAAAPVLDKLVEEVNLKRTADQAPVLTGLPTNQALNTLDNIDASSSLELIEAKINANKKNK
ncbi:MAG: hypothetical protein WC441_03720 [Patescibacteria group bacterium]